MKPDGASSSACFLRRRPWPVAASLSAAATERNEDLLRELQQVHGLSERVDAADPRDLRRVRGSSARGIPAVTEHPATPEACVAKLREAGVSYEQPESDRICGASYMAPLYDPSREKPQDARACIDRFEFPDIPCAYPVVWVRAREAALLCEAKGKRLCDAHEWEGACAGSLEEPDYRFDLAKGRDPVSAVESMRAAHNRAHAASKSWSYGPTYRTGICAASSQKTPGCGGGEWARCGSNTFPAGFFPDVPQQLACYDLNGNAAEHMNLPLDESQMASAGSRDAGRHGDEGELVHLRPLPRPRGLVPLACAVLARQPGDGSEEPRELPPRLPLLQDDPLTSQTRSTLRGADARRAPWTRIAVRAGM